jgi:hypothetical protein
VRMGLHTGEPGEQRYVGIGVHKAARIAPQGTAGRCCSRRRHASSWRTRCPPASRSVTSARGA